jgi:Tol biopolymer transport system component/DNA-binding winged helix-turn-helix (wHTH) protein
MKPDATLVRFGAFEADLDSGELRKNGLRLKLQDQPFEVLRILLERPGEIVSREELRTRLWPSGTFVDFDHSLNASINKLREALADTAANPRFIQTVPRRGYRFVAPAERCVPAPQRLSPPPPDPIQQTSPQRTRGLSRPAPLVAALAIVAVVAAALSVWSKSSSSHSLPSKPIPLTSSPGRELQPDFSPDANYIVYSGGLGGIHNPDIYVKQIGSAAAVHRLTGSPYPEIGPKWSPDGRQIAFVRVQAVNDSAEAEVAVIPALGGPTRKVTTIRIPLLKTFGAEWFVDWFPNSEALVIADRRPNGENLALAGVDIRTGERWELTTPPEGMGDLDPAVSPDGSRLAFTRYGGNHESIYLLRLDARYRSIGEPRARTAGALSRAPVWTPDGRQILFASGPQHWKRLFRMSAYRQSAPEQVGFAVEGVQPLSPAISANWNVAYPVYRAETDIYRTDLSRTAAYARSLPFASSTFLDHLPEYSPDGRLIAFISNRSGSNQIWLSDSNTVNSHQLTFLPEEQEAKGVRWSPDGRRLLFISGTAVYSIGVDGGPPTIHVKDPPVAGYAADWSRDGKWIVYASNTTGRSEIWKAPVIAASNPVGTIQITRNGGTAPRTGVEGHFIYYTKGNLPSEVWKVPLEGGPEVRVVDKVIHSGAFTANSDGVYFVPFHDRSGRDAVHFLHFRSGRRTAVASLAGHPMWGLSISPDNRFLLTAQMLGEGEADLMLVEKFR